MALAIAGAGTVVHGSDRLLAPKGPVGSSDRNELFDIDGVRCRQLHCLDLLGLEEHVLILGKLIALDEFLA